MSTAPQQETSNPSRAAKQINVPPSTLRLWAKQYAEFLSPGANPPSGEERRFTAADVETLKAVVQLRHNGMLPSDIAQRLRNSPATGLQDSSGEGAAGLPVHAPTEPGHDAIQAFLARTETADKLTDIDRRLERLEGKRTLILVALVAFAVGVLLVVAVVWLILIYANR